MRKLISTLVFSLLFITFSNNLKAQTTLATGDLAFSGYISTDTDPIDRFSFVLLTNITSGTVIRFTDFGWRTDLNAFNSGAALESEIVFTAGSAYNAGTEIMIQGTSATVVGGGSAGTVTLTTGAQFLVGNFSLSTSGDQLFAYQGSFASPVFISGIHKNAMAIANGDPNNTSAAAWDGVLTAGNINGSTSGKPAALTTGTNAIWIGSVNGSAPFSTEWDNAGFTCGPDVSTATLARAALNNPANWATDDGSPAGFTLPTGCNYVGILSGPPSFTTHPSSTTICEIAGTSFTIVATSAVSYQWQVNTGSGFNNISNNATYTGATSVTLTLVNVPAGFNGYLYRCVATNGSGSTNSNNATLTVTPLPVSPSLLAKTPATTTVADGTNVSATFTAGSGGTGCSDDYRYTTNGGASYLPYTPGANISTTGLAAVSGIVQIEGRRANCSAGCQGSYTVLASWIVTPLPGGATTLVAGDIAFSGYASSYPTLPEDNFSFVLLKNVGPGTVINFTDNGWLSTNVFRTGEQTVTWTAPAGGLSAGTEIKITDLTATKSGGGAAGTVTGTGLQLSTSGDQILAYQGTAGAPTFISAIHMNLHTTLLGDPVSTTSAAWDGTMNTANSSALPTGLTTGVNCIWIGTQDVSASEYDNSRYGNCSAPAVSGPVSALRALLNNQANWISDNNQPPSFTLPTGCNYLGILVPTITVTGTPLTTFTGCEGTPSAEQNFSVSGSALTGNINITAPAGFEISQTSGSGFTSSIALTPSSGSVPATTIYVRTTAAATGSPAGNISITSAGATTETVAVSATLSAVPTTALAGPDASVCGLTTALAGNTPTTGTGTWTQFSGPGSSTFVNANSPTSSVTVSVAGIYVFRWTIANAPCPSSSDDVQITFVSPVATATPSSQSTCSGAAITTIVLSGTGTTYNWTRDNAATVTGIATSGSGDISGSLTNTTSAPVTVTFTITPSVSGCDGAPITATVTVNPIPDATATPSSQSRCSGAGIQPIIMGSAVSGTSFNWVRDNVPTIGGSIPASGSGNISGNLVNNTGSPVTVTFTITPTANGCPGTPITATVTVNPLPTALITGPVGAVPVCQNSGAELSAATSVGTGLTYAWGRSLFTTPFTPLGSAVTQPIEVGGNYLLTVTNTYGCVDTAMQTALVADYIFNGTLAPGDAVQTGRLNRFASISTCAVPKGCPGTFTTVGSRVYDAYTVTNPHNTPVCATIGITSFCATNIFCVAYTGAYNPTSLCTNYLADGGSSFTFSGFYEATIPANGTITIVVHEVNSNTGCSGYRLSVHLPRQGITVSPAGPYCSGAPITLTAPGANNYSWTPGGATTQAIVVTPPLGTTNYSVQSGHGNWGCVGDTSVNVVVGSTPNVTPVANQYFCAGSTAGPITLTGTVSGTTYNWTNTNTAIGLAASGTGDIPAFTATNSTAGPISGTITVTPVNGPCTGTPITFTITVANQPMITSVTEDSVCAPGGIVNLAAAGTGLIHWYDALTAGNLVNTGTTYSPNITNTTTYYVESLVNTPAATTLTMPSQSNTFPGNTRGYWFTAPVDFVITALRVPTTASSGPQNVAILRFNGNTPPPVFSATTNAFTTLFMSRQNSTIGKIPCNIQVRAGEVIGILGSRGGINTYAPGDYVTSIFGQPVQLERMGMQFPLETTNPRDIWREFGATTSISRVEFDYTSISCPSSPRVPVIGTVLPQPIATATPASQTVCSGPITTIVLTSTVSGTTYAWTRDNTVNVTGIGASGTGDISGTLTNTTTVPQTVTFTITPTSPDGCVGATITATVTVNAIPTITCPANITVSNDLNQCGAIVTYAPTVTGIPVPTLTYAFSGATTASGSGDGSGSFFNVGITNVTITATNSCGTASCSFTVTVNDTQFPTIICPAPVTVSCASAVPAPDIASVTAGDNCPGVVVTHQGDVISAQTCTNRYTVTRTYRATDASGNFTECTQIITVNDQTPPVLTCPAAVTVSCTSAVPAVNVLAVTGVSDNCGGPVTITHTGDVISNQTCPNRYTITRTYRATDVCGNFAECTQIITVDDQTAPVLTCPAAVTVSCASAVPAVNVLAVTGVSDNCGGPVTITHTGDVISNQTCANRFTVTRTYRATDACGNFAECTQIITVNDQTPPTLTCPAAVTVSCAAAVPAPNIALVTGVSDNCAGVVTVTHVGDVISNQTCANRFTVTRTYRATDVCGNFAECTQIITVNDVTPPTLTCPAAVTVSCAAAVPAPNIALVTGVSDNCAGVVTVTHVSDVISNQTCANRFTVTRTYRATDVCGNFAECTQIITVNDQTPPTVTCPAPVTVSCASAVPAPNIALVTATDNCAGAITIVHVGDVISNQTCPNRFTVTRTYRATDVCGNSATCTQIITVNDQTAPVITCPANITVTTPVGSCTAVVNFTVTATDNCAGPVTIVSSPASGSVFQLGTTLVTSTATDACGNSSSCTFTVTVLDAQLPTITAQPQNRTVCVGQNATFSVTAITTPSPNGPLAYQWQLWNGTAWVNVSGATASSYTITGVTQAMNTNTFRVQITGLCTTIFSNPATLTVNPLPSITLSAHPLAALLPNQVTSITATVNPTGGSFVWSLNGGVIPGVTGNTLGPINVNGIGSYQAVYTDPNGCVSTSAALSITAMASSQLWVYPVPNTGTFNVRFYNQTGEAATVKVFNALGQQVYSQALTLGIAYSNIVVNLGDVPAGVYIVKVVNSSNVELASKRVVVYHP